MSSIKRLESITGRTGMLSRQSCSGTGVANQFLSHRIYVGRPSVYDLQVYLCLVGVFLSECSF